jgi:hypothetical protein
VRFIREEATRDAAKSPSVPRSKEFFDSFTYRVDRDSVEVISTWPWLHVILEGTDGPFPMPWLTAARGVHRVPLVDEHGAVIIRSTPLTTDRAWVHPGIARHTFIQRAWERAARRVGERCAERGLKSWVKEIFGG